MGREEFATDLIRAPGGGALNAIGAARLGLRTAAGFKLGEDEAGTFLRSQLAGEGIIVIGEPQGATAVTVVLPYSGDRAFVTYDPEPFNPPSFAGLDAVRVMYTLDQVDGLPASRAPLRHDRRPARRLGTPDARYHASVRRDGIPEQ